jgi:hypothetical protein
MLHAIKGVDECFGLPVLNHFINQGYFMSFGSGSYTAMSAGGTYGSSVQRRDVWFCSE